MMEQRARDVLAAILRRLSPRSLAVSRSVCRGWRATIDARCALRKDLLPVSLGGIFVSLRHEPAPPEFFGRPSSSIAGTRLQDYVEMEDRFGIPHIKNCCNGLLLLDGRVVNPATREWVRLPPCPSLVPVPRGGFGGNDAYLAYDPMEESPHYEVLLIDTYFCYTSTSSDGGSSCWPPSPYRLPVYSSRTGTWETRSFVREGGAAVTIAEARSTAEPVYRHAVYWHQMLYVHCKCDFIMRIALSHNKYQVIKLPTGIISTAYHQPYLGKSEKGVYCAAIDNDEYRLQVWFLSEFGDRLEWIFKYDIDLGALVVHLSRNHNRIIDRPWTLQDGNRHKDNSKVQEIPKWDSDNDNVLDFDKDTGEKYPYECISIFGFHPFKEVVFLFLQSNQRVMACHLNNSKIQDLGQLEVNYRGDVIDTAFVYTPCRMTGLC